MFKNTSVTIETLRTFSCLRSWAGVNGKNGTVSRLLCQGNFVKE